MIWPSQESAEQHIVRMLREWRVTHIAMPDEIRVAQDVWRMIEDNRSARHQFAPENTVSIEGVRVVCDPKAPPFVIYTHCS